MNRRVTDLELRRRLLVEQSQRQRRRLHADFEATGHWIRLARLIVLTARRAARVYRYWNHATQP